MSWILILFLGNLAFAQPDQIAVDIGIGVLNSVNMKTVSVSKQTDFDGPVKLRGTIGGWTDSAGNGRTGSLFASAQLGFEVERNGVVAGVFSGPSIISFTDSVLGSNFEVTSDLHLGLQDLRYNYIGGFYRHISDAGLTSINIGRDVIGLELRFVF